MPLHLSLTESPVGGSFAIPLMSDENCGALGIPVGVVGSEPLPPLGSIAAGGVLTSGVVGVTPIGV